MTLKDLLAKSADLMAGLKQALDDDGEITIDGNGCNAFEAAPAMEIYHELIVQAAAGEIPVETLLARSSDLMSSLISAQASDSEITVGGNGCNASEAGPAIKTYHTMVVKAARAAGLPVATWAEITENDPFGCGAEHITYVPVAGNEEALKLVKAHAGAYDGAEDHCDDPFNFARFKTTEAALRTMSAEWSTPVTFVHAIDLEALGAADWSEGPLLAGGLVAFQKKD